MNVEAILKNLHFYYDKFNNLGFHHSLADADFREINYFFPECIFQRRDAGLRDPIESLIPSDWDQETTNLMLFQLNHGAIAYKEGNWNSISPTYLARHCFGFGNFEEFSFGHYFAAWSLKYLQGRSSELEPMSFYLFCHLKSALKQQAERGEKLYAYKNLGIESILRYIEKANDELEENAKICLSYF